MNITSPHNPRLKELRRLARRRERERSGRFVAEGEDLIGAARAAGRPALAGYRLASSALGEPGFHEVDAHTMRALSSLGSGTRVIAIYEQRWAPAPAGGLCLYLHAIGDPGNVGTALRCAQAFGASCVALGPRCADPHSPKAVRASMGAIFTVPLARAGSIAALPGLRVALAPRRGIPLQALAARRAGALTLLVGAEREGLPEEVIGECDLVAHIPIAGESLNAAMAAAVALYEITRDGDSNSTRVRA
ncbi:MAG: RNA methyltransferase [Solirubrobacterales bacterium]|nr:RNA methyltransferase [Solirubrobacterales bacterium]